MQDGLALLEWYKAMGVDEAISETPTDWSAMTGFALPREAMPRNAPQPAAAPPGVARTPAPKAPIAPVTPAASPERRMPAAAPDAAVMAARSKAGEANSLAELEATLRSFDGCGLKATAKSLCFYRGAEKARLMLIGEAPGRDEDIEGKPFVGRAGQLLDKMLAAMSLTEADVHITNVVYWRPPGNRTPTPQETEVLRPFLTRQITLVEPSIILLLGGAAAKQVLGVTEGIMRLRGKWLEYKESDGRAVRAMATLHPAYLLRTPIAKRLAWRDLLLVRQELRK